MKSDELSDILKEIIELLNLYPGKDLPFILKDLISLKKSEMPNENKNHAEIPKTIKQESDHDLKERIDRLANDIESLSMAEIEERLNSEELFPSMAYIKYFAKKIGVDLASRQSRINSIHTVKSHIDRMRIDRTISKRND